MKKEDVKSSCRNGSGIVSVIFGIFSVIVLGFFGIILGVIGLIFGLVQNKNEKNKWGTWGIWLNIIGIVLGIIVAYLLVNYLPDLLAKYQSGLATGAN